MNKCKGCGIDLQSEIKLWPGYVENINNDYCERCFKIINYNEDVLELDMDNDILTTKINDMKQFSFFLCDFLMLNKNIVSMYNNITNDKVFVITKVDSVPKNVKFDLFIKRIKKVYNIKKVIVFSKKNGYGTDEIKSLIKKNKKCLFVGPSNSGKSSLINYLTDSKLIESNFKNTTQDFIEIDYEGCTLTDAPGFSMEEDSYKLKKALKPKTLKLKEGYILLVDKYSIAFDGEVNLTLFFPDDVEYKTVKTKIYEEERAQIDCASDILLGFIGFIYLNSKTKVYTNKNVEVRESIIGG